MDNTDVKGKDEGEKKESMWISIPQIHLLVQVKEYSLTVLELERYPSGYEHILL